MGSDFRFLQSFPHFSLLFDNGVVFSTIQLVVWEGIFVSSNPLFHVSHFDKKLVNYLHPLCKSNKGPHTVGAIWSCREPKNLIAISRLLRHAALRRVNSVRPLPLRKKHQQRPLSESVKAPYTAGAVG